MKIRMIQVNSTCSREDYHMGLQGRLSCRSPDMDYHSNFATCKKIMYVEDLW